MDDSAYKVLTDYQTATVTLLALMSAATGDVSKHGGFICSIHNVVTLSC